MTDRIAGLVLLAAALAVALLTSRVDPGFGGAGPSPRTIPWALSTILAACGLWLALRPRPESGRTAPERRAVVRVLAMGALTLGLTLAFPLIDFRVLAWAFMLVSMLAIGARGRLELATVPVVVALILDTLFRQGFGVVLPSWI